jgi:hypothetical protein
MINPSVHDELLWPTPHERVASEEVATVAHAWKETSTEFLDLTYVSGGGQH